eukprot:jgi/Botrbrau1/22181/Bobra.168_1s0013.1
MADKEGNEAKASPAGTSLTSSLFGGAGAFSPLKNFWKSPSSPPVVSDAKPINITPIKTPHNDLADMPSPISHPEMCFSPTDIGIWEIERPREKRPFS